MYSTIRLKILVLSLFSFINSFAQQRTVATAIRKIVNINQNWSFAKDPKKQLSASSLNGVKWAVVQIPHTWNAFDVMDDVPGYYRGMGWYKKKLALRPEWKNKNLYVHFEGANQETTVYVNGKQIAHHIGGYNAFRIPLKNLKFNGTDEIALKVDNSFKESIAPLTGDFTFFGGLYRNVSLLVLPSAHFDDQQFATNGVYVHAENVSKAKAEVVIKGSLLNLQTAKELLVTSVLTDASGKKVQETKFLTRATNQLISFELPKMQVDQPVLWSPEQPYLYVATTKLIDNQTGKTLDEVKTNVGLRFFSFDVKKGFFLNGAPYKLIGTSRHQDFAGKGNAVPSDLAVKDVALIKEMGGNFLRVAHYPQDQAVLDACDRLGILASVEIPIVNEITESDVFYNNCHDMQLEMIKQNYNHPSIIIWAYMNEVLLKMRFRDNPERKKIYLKNIENLAQRLEDLTRKTDPTRYTMMSNHGDVNGYLNAGLVKIPMLVGWNLYQGWYGGKSEDFGPNLDKIHAQVPDKPLLVTEFGADVDPRIHAFPSIKFDKSLEYGMLYHQIYIDAILERPFVAGAFVWNLADFSSETRDETMPHINNKGLLTLARKPKNTYYLYKANFNPKPYVKIGDGSWSLRGGVSNNTSTATQLVQVITNLQNVELFVNGKSLGIKSPIAKVADWQVDFKNGKNELKAIAIVNGVQVADVAQIDFVLIPSSMANFKSINVLLGSQRQFIDEQKKEVWLPSQPYQQGSWGHIGGEAFKIKNSSRQVYGTDKNIRGTFNDPIYQTQLVGLDGYQLAVPKGKYEVILHFSELMGNGIQSVLPYNLDSLIAVSKEVPEQRVFDVLLNDKLVIKNINLAATYGVANSVQKRFECVVTDDKGLRILFKGIKGKAVLNALQVRKM